MDLGFMSRQQRGKGSLGIAWNWVWALGQAQPQLLSPGSISGRRGIKCFPPKALTGIYIDQVHRGPRKW